VLVKTGETIVTAMTSNAAFATPTPPLATVGSALTKLDSAETATKTRAKGTKEARDAARVEVVQLLHALKAYVQTVADATPDQSEAIIASAGMSSKKKAVHDKPPFAVKVGPTSGTVRVSVKAAARRASYEWEWSSDGAKTWTLVPPSLQSKTTIPGLPAGTTCQFRYRAVTRTGAGDWSQPLSFLVQ